MRCFTAAKAQEVDQQQPTAKQTKPTWRRRPRDAQNYVLNKKHLVGGFNPSEKYYSSQLG